uniref:Uncharacterized protein n=1 Tax=Ditylenchus dipsaci TaxID=166011 RepID=A0A915DMT0_9BILA
MHPVPVLYTEYYLLDSIRCPQCQQPCEMRIALKAPTNQTLCNELQCSKKAKAASNVTVIHVPDKTKSTIDKEQPPQDPFPSATPVSHHPTNERPAMENEIQSKQPSWRCSDCKRRLSAKSVKSLNAISRFCECNLARSSGVQKFDALTCLQCCVDKHNGHSLVTLMQLEKENHKLVHELRQIHQRLQHFSTIFQQKVSQTSQNSDLSSVVHAKQVLMRESQQCYDKFTHLLENHFLKTLPSDQVCAIRSRLLSSVNRLQRMCSWVEEATQSPTSTQSFGNNKKSTSFEALATTSKKQSASQPIINSTGLSTAIASISTLIQLYCNCCDQEVKEQYKSQFTSLKTNKDALENLIEASDPADDQMYDC